MVVAIGVSIWVEPYTYRKSATNGVGVSRGFSLVLSDGVLMSAYWKDLPTESGAPASAISGFGKHGALLPAWYSPPSLQTGYTKLPLAYPAALLLAASLWLLRSNRTRHRPGHCPGCGYSMSGLGSATCPECGREREGAAP